ncbi:thiamine phosphate synthase [Proteobacteria bacterium 005FR1]|nr:thiamine phosphate synthase [Proteobacteria bacterium 005FR1]
MIEGLYAITNEDLMPGGLLLEKTEAALLGGCRLVQYRNKMASAEAKRIEAAKLRELCERHGASLIVNDSVSLAFDVNAHGVHLGQDDEAVDRAREILGDKAIVGATCHASLSLARRACDLGADYLAFGRFFPSQTKPQAPPAELSLIAEIKAQLHLPTVAIGGINRDNAASLIAAGADCLAVSHELFRGDDLDEIRRRAAQFTSLFQTSTESRQEPQ